MDADVQIPIEYVENEYLRTILTYEAAKIIMSHEFNRFSWVAEPPQSVPVSFTPFADPNPSCLYLTVLFLAAGVACRRCREAGQGCNPVPGFLRQARDE
ncbi:hypothetical protein N0V85_002405 [Neurospora sp. IMI 360204]|nr:hypothetical protein N0V85_002405 [Neurospora sp. IMI 360204]